MASQGPSEADLPTGGTPAEQAAPATVRAGASAAAGLGAGVLASVPGDWQLGTLIGWDVAAVVLLVWTWAAIWRLDAAATARLAVREDPGRATADALVVIASVASLAAVGLVITLGGVTAAGERDLRAALAVASVFLSWLVVQTVSTSHYARLYYTPPAGGIDFNEDAPPRYRDFAYLAFTVGMTYQVSDTDLKTHQMRAAVLRHAVISYLLGAVILATTINLVAGLFR
jgi:uncharacterized membrane protein